MNRCLLVLSLCGIIACIQSCHGTKSGQITSTRSVGQHLVKITEPGNETGYSNVAHTADGKEIYTYESDQFLVRLEDEVLTVNGKRYILTNEDDAIRLENGHVEINGKPAEPADGSHQ